MTIVETRAITGGVDTHADTHVAAALDPVGGLLGVQEFPVSPAGYARLLAWLGELGAVCLAGIEGTGSYGAGLARYIAAAGVRVVEVDRAGRQDRRRAGKSDPLDAVSAARAAQSGRAIGAPKGRDGAVEAIRVLIARSARRGAGRDGGLRIGVPEVDVFPAQGAGFLGTDAGGQAQGDVGMHPGIRSGRPAGSLRTGWFPEGLTSAALRSGQVSGRNRQMRLALVSSKGGTGKTTSAVSLAMVLHRRGRTLAVDCDPQGSLMNWSEAAAEEGNSLPFTVVSMATRDVHIRLADLGAGYEHVIVDTPPGDLGIIRSAILASTIILVPVSPTGLDLNRIRPTFEVLAEIGISHPVEVGVLLTKVRRGTRSARAARGILAEHGYPTMKTEIPLAEHFAAAFGSVPAVLSEYWDLLVELRK